MRSFESKNYGCICPHFELIRSKEKKSKKKRNFTLLQRVELSHTLLGIISTEGGDEVSPTSTAIGTLNLHTSLISRGHMTKLAKGASVIFTHIVSLWTYHCQFALEMSIVHTYGDCLTLFLSTLPEHCTMWEGALTSPSSTMWPESIGGQRRHPFSLWRKH